MNREPSAAEQATAHPAREDQSSTPRVLLSVEEAADRLTFSRTRVYALIKSGDIDSVKVGRLRRIPDDAVREYVKRLLTERSTHRDHAA